MQRQSKQFPLDEQPCCSATPPSLALRNYRPILAFAMLAAAISPASALSQPCDKAKAISEQAACAKKALSAVEAEHERIWSRVTADIDRNSHVPRRERDLWKARLREAQRSWTQHVDKDCEEVVPYEWYGGAGASAGTDLCRLAKLQFRIKELKERYGLR